jgi:phenylacetate-CoA ligase
MRFLNNKFYFLVQLLWNERRPLSQLMAYQNKKLRDLVSYSYTNVPFYRELYQEKGVNPNEISSLRDLTQLPIVDKNDFHRHAPQNRLSTRCQQLENLIPINTSGSSGLVLQFFIDHAYDQYRKAQNIRPYITNGCTVRDRMLKYINTAIPDKKLYEKLGLLKQRYVFSDSDINAQLRALTDWRPTVIQGFGSCIGLLASRMKDSQGAKISPRMIFTDSELLHPTLRRHIEEAFESPVIDVYGTMETENIAYECSERKGYHIAVDSVVLEIVKNGKPVGPGEAGEIVCTVLDNYTMPFIRYNLHDTGSLSEALCPCGRSFPLMNILEGRSDDFAVYENGERKSPRTFLGFFDALAGAIQEFQIIQEEVDAFKVYVVSKRYASIDIESTMRAILQKEFPRARVDVKCVDKIKRDASGKFRAFRCLVKCDHDFYK